MVILGDGLIETILVDTQSILLAIYGFSQAIVAIIGKLATTKVGIPRCFPKHTADVAVLQDERIPIRFPVSVVSTCLLSNITNQEF